MVKMTVAVQKIGGSLVVRIPKKFADEKGISVGDRVNIAMISKEQKPDFSWIGSIPELGGWDQKKKHEIKDW